MHRIDCRVCSQELLLHAILATNLGVRNTCAVLSTAPDRAPVMLSLCFDGCTGAAESGRTAPLVQVNILINQVILIHTLRISRNRPNRT